MQDSGDTTIPQDVQEKLLRFARRVGCGEHARQVVPGDGRRLDGHRRFDCEPPLPGELPGHARRDHRHVRVRGLDRGIYDHDEYERALAWTKENCQEGKDYNAPEIQQSRAQKDAAWETSVKMALIVRDLMIGNLRLAEMGYGEEAHGRNAGFSFRDSASGPITCPTATLWRRSSTPRSTGTASAPDMVATENDAMNGISMLFGHLLTNTAQIFADVRTFWSPESVKRVTGYERAGTVRAAFCT